MHFMGLLQVFKIDTFVPDCQALTDAWLEIDGETMTVLRHREKKTLFAATKHFPLI